MTDMSDLSVPQPVEFRLTTKDYQRISQLAYERFGVDLRNGKRELVSARLAKLLRKTEFRSVDEFYQHVLADQSGESLIKLINALTTNHTSFFREAAHFELLRTQIVPELCSRSKIEVWSAAAATGEEIYSIAICLLEQLGAAGYQKVHILGSDISTKALATADTGAYSADRLQGLSGDLVRRYFLRGRNSWEGWYKIRPEVRKLVALTRLNLIDEYSHPSSYSVIFCRNVLIYFDQPTQKRVVERMIRFLEPGGYLFTGHAESLGGLDHGLEYMQPAVYRRPLSGLRPERRSDK